LCLCLPDETVRDLRSKLDSARHQLMKMVKRPSLTVSAATTSSSLKDANFDGTCCRLAQLWFLRLESWSRGVSNGLGILVVFGPKLVLANEDEHL